MPLLRLKLTDLQTLSAPFADSLGGDCGPGDAADLEARIRRQFRFLPDPITVKVEGEEVLVEFPEETPGSRAEAARLAEKAGKRASEGNYGKAIDIYQRVLELQPSLHRARRDLAMIYAETGDVDNATNHLIEVLRLDPSDSWNWVVLGNLYAGGKNDPETAEKFIRKALELNPKDPWALNSLATFTQKAGRSEEALALFDQAIESHPDLPNPLPRQSTRPRRYETGRSGSRNAGAAFRHGPAPGRAQPRGLRQCPQSLREGAGAARRTAAVRGFQVRAKRES